MSVKYKGFTIEKAKGTEFGHPTFIKYGKEYDIQEYIEASREDTEIIPCLEKYGCLKPMELNAQGLYGDFTKYNDLRSTMEKKIQIENMWNQLDTKVKNEFNNDMNEFIDRGMEWAERKVKEQSQPAAEPKTEPAAEPKGE